MKKSMLILLCFSSICLSNKLSAQVSMGFNAGLSLSKLIYAMRGISLNTDRLEQFTASVPVEVRISEIFALQPELSYLTKGGEITESDYFGGYSYTSESWIKIHYLELPVLGKFSFGNTKIKFDLYGGPVFGYGLSGSSYDKTVSNGVVLEETHELNFEDDKVNRFDFSLSIGAGTSLLAGLSKLSFRIQYQAGISNMDTSDPQSGFGSDISVTNNNILFTFGLLTPISTPKPKK